MAREQIPWRPPLVSSGASKAASGAAYPRSSNARDTLRVAVRDRRRVVVNDVGGEVTRGDLATVVVR